MENNSSLSTGSPSVGKQLMILAIVLLIVAVGFTYVKWQQAEKRLLPTMTDNQAILAQVGKIYKLPQGEQVTVATVMNVAELRKQNAFYNKANNGDYLIVMKDRAILFDAKANMIIDVTAVQIIPSSSSSSSSSKK